MPENQIAGALHAPAIWFSEPGLEDDQGAGRKFQGLTLPYESFIISK